MRKWKVDTRLAKKKVGKKGKKNAKRDKIETIGKRVDKSEAG